ncbi:hypothetical protein EAY18_27575 [Vibrio anguillarum]|nr:hypothetical protein [Vibrio anguillarum]
MVIALRTIKDCLYLSRTKIYIRHLVKVKYGYFLAQTKIIWSITVLNTLLYQAGYFYLPFMMSSTSLVF